MARHFICDYGNCTGDGGAVLVTTHDRRLRFCCMNHAAQSLTDEAARTHANTLSNRLDGTGERSQGS